MPLNNCLREAVKAHTIEHSNVNWIDDEPIPKKLFKLIKSPFNKLARFISANIILVGCKKRLIHTN
jgi:hypothetical protein